MSISWDFTGRVVLVTGASQGLGAAILSAFARAGASTAINYWPDSAGANAANAARLAEQLTAEGRAVLAVPADVTDSAAVAAMMDAVRSRFGRLDVLVNNAGILRDRSLAKMSDAEWDSVIATNLSGVFRVTRAAAGLLADGGCVINISSVAGLEGIFGQTNYGAAKAGVIGFTRAAAKEFARRGVTVNAVAPGLVDTPMAAAIPETAREQLLRQVPMGRIAQPADIVNAVLFLAAAESRYITGQVLCVDGGWHA